MGKTNIEWADAVWNPITGCTKVSDGCRNCYAERMSKRLRGRCGYPADDPFRVTLHPDRLNEPLKWKKPRRIFVCSMGDLFHKDVPDSFKDKVFAVMAAASQHTFLVLTKRAQDMHDYIGMAMFDMDCNYEGWYEEIGKLGVPDVSPLMNVHLGVSVEDQATADERIPFLLQTPAAKRFVSIEPMIGAVDLEMALEQFHTLDPLLNRNPAPIDQVILGGETGPGARPMHPDWPRKVRDDCKAAGVPFMFKQWGAWGPVHELRVNEPGIVGKPWHNFDPDNSVCRVGKKAAGHLLDGVEHRDLVE